MAGVVAGRGQNPDVVSPERCVWCGREVGTGLVHKTVDHVVPQLKGGPRWPENLLPACGRCNRQRGHRTPGDWLEECERRGWSPDRSAVVASLRSLADAIAARGGMRRARAYVDSQLRRLDGDGDGDRPS
jgi:HNH endonuclease